MTAIPSERLNEQLDDLRRRMRAMQPESDDALNRAESFLQRLSPGPSTQVTEAEPQFDPATDDEVPDDFEANVDHGWDWVATIQRATPMRQERQAACALEIEAGVLARGILDGRERPALRVQEHELRQLVRQGETAFDEMFTGNLRLVLYWAQRWSRGDAFMMEEHFQEGCLGLRRAIQGWDALRGYTFSTYASWHLRQAMDRGKDNLNNVIRIPVHVQDSWGSSEPLTDLAVYARELIDGLVSWDVLKENEQFDDSSLFQAPLEDESAERAEREYLLGGLAWLDAREQQVLALRHGLCGEEPKTLDDIGEGFGLTRERIRQIEGKAVTRLQLFWLNQSLPYQNRLAVSEETVAVLVGCETLSERTLNQIMRQTGWSARQAADEVAKAASRLDTADWHD